MKQKPKFNLYLYFSVFSANLSTFTLGVAFAWSSPAISRLNGEIDPDLNPLSAPITPQQESWIASLLPLGAALSVFVSGYASDRIGRKATLLMSGIPNVVGMACLAYASDVWLFYVGRFLCGLGSGFIFTVVPVYVGELSESGNRGSLGCVLVFFICAGNLFVYVAAVFWTISFLSFVSVFPPFVFMMVFGCFAPESPYYYIAKGYREDAEKVLLKLRYNSMEIVEDELRIIERNVKENLSKNRSLADFIRDRGLFAGIKITVGLVFFQQFSGINVLFFYMQSIFEDSDAGLPSNVCTILVGVVQFASSVVASLAIDRYGRRLLLLTSSTGATVAQSLFSVYFLLQSFRVDLTGLSFVPVAVALGFVFFYTVGYGPIAFSMVGEVFPPDARSAASTITVFCCLASVFATTTVFPYLIEIIGMAATFGILSAFCFAGGCFAYFCVPETKGKSLQEIEEMLMKK